MATQTSSLPLKETENASAESIVLSIKRLPNNADLPLPSYESDSAAGMDLPAAISEDTIIEPGKVALIPTGLSIALPHGYEAQIRPRSGLAAKDGITVLNTPGTVDADYRGEVKVILINLGDAPFTVTRGMRIAQMVIAPVMQIQIAETVTLEDTSRGKGGFGSTGR